MGIGVAGGDVVAARARGSIIGASWADVDACRLGTGERPVQVRHEDGQVVAPARFAQPVQHALDAELRSLLSEEARPLGASRRCELRASVERSLRAAPPAGELGPVEHGHDRTLPVAGVRFEARAGYALFPGTPRSSVATCAPVPGSVAGPR